MATEAFCLDPYPVLNRLREEAPVHWHAEGYWTLSRYADVESGVKNHAAFSNLGAAYARAGRNPGSYAPAMSVRRLSARDQPSHTALRRLMARAFSPRGLVSIKPRVAAIVDELIGEMRERQRSGEGVDFTRDFAYPLTILSINLILGVPDSIRSVYRNYTTGVDDAMGEYFAELVRHKQKHPGDDMTSHLIEAATAGHEYLTLGEVHYYLGALWTGGNWTTTMHVANAAALLQSVPGVRDELRRDPRQVPAFVEEALRFDSPVLFTAKTALTDLELHGETIRKGDVVNFLYAAANRDPRQFETPGRFDLRRQPNRHLAFSEGIHHCIGAPLARIEAVAAFERLVREDVGLEVDPGRGLKRSDPITPNLYGYRELPARIAA
jgi:cytochrome P450